MWLTSLLESVVVMVTVVSIIRFVLRLWRRVDPYRVSQQQQDEDNQITTKVSPNVSPYPASPPLAPAGAGYIGYTTGNDPRLDSDPAILQELEQNDDAIYQVQSGDTRYPVLLSRLNAWDSALSADIIKTAGEFTFDPNYSASYENLYVFPSGASAIEVCINNKCKNVQTNPIQTAFKTNTLNTLTSSSKTAARYILVGIKQNE